MNIAIFSDNFYPEISGISDTMLLLAHELAKRGHYINFYVPRYSAADYAKASVPETELDLGPNIRVVRFFSLPYPAGTGQARVIVPTGLRWIGVRKFRPDIVHSQLFFGAGIEALIASRMIRVPLVGTNHTAIKGYLRYAPLKSARFTRRVLAYVNWYYGRCDLTTAPAQFLLDEMVRDGFAGAYRMIPNPLDTTMFRPRSDRDRLKKQFGVGRATVIHAGRLAAERRIDVIFRAVAMAKKNFPEIRLLIAGIGSAETDLRNLSRTLGIQDAVSFLGLLDKPALADAYGASEIFAITSVSDVQSTVMMQAMAAGISIIGARAGGTPEFINAKNGVLIEPGDHETLAKEIINLLKNHEKRKRLGTGARAFVDRFSAPKIAGVWERMYEEVIRRYNQQRPI